MPEFLIKMASGTLIDLGNPTLDVIKYEDIIHSLSNINRYTGHAGTYSVLEHSVIVGRLLPPELRLAGQVHDFHETYVGDLSSPVKRLFRHLSGGKDFGYESTVAKFDDLIHRKFGITWPLSREDADLVRWADLTALSTEMVQLFPKNERDREFMQNLPAPAEMEIACLAPVEARELFNNEFLATTH
jgi:5'-deoxynucleotidase YfbR-like HD superfamily hydrolase